MIRIKYSNQVNYFIIEKNALEIKTMSYLTSKFPVFGLDLQMSTKVKNIFVVESSCYDFLLNFYWNFLSRNVFGYLRSLFSTIWKIIHDFLSNSY